uniref:Uncharacterized protein n=1 Tax=Anguilla anguilla TaxID=7936 RepID=A0A0E9R656_ANGAN
MSELSNLYGCQRPDHWWAFTKALSMILEIYWNQ